MCSPDVLALCNRVEDTIPTAVEIKGQHVEHKQWVMLVRASSKGFAQRAPEIVFALFGRHRDMFMFP